MSSADTSDPRGGIQVIARAAAILRALKHQRDGMSLGQIAARVGLPRSTVQRIVGALQSERLVVSGMEGGVRLGPELHALSDGARADMIEFARPLLVELSRETGETVDLATPRGDRLVFVDQVPGTQRLRAVSSVGEAFPFTPTANGKACLSLMDEDVARERALAEWKELGLRRDIDAFVRELRAIKKQGVAYDEDEHTEGISAVGVAFTEPGGAIHAISVPAPTMRFRRNRKKLTAAILRTRERLIAALAPLGE